MMMQPKFGRERRHATIRARVKGTAERPRVSVFRSNKQVVCQLVDDVTGKTLVAVSGAHLGKDAKGTKTERAAMVGKMLAEQATAKRIKQVVFDRGGYKYHGRVKAVAEELRKGGLEL